MIDWITIQGFRSVRHTERLQLGRINVLVGANGSGKSNLFHALALLQAVSQGNLQRYVRRSGGAEWLLHFGAEETNRIAIEVAFADSEIKARYRVELASEGAGTLHVRGEQMHSADPDGPSRSRMQLVWSENPDRRESGLFASPAAERPAGIERLREHLSGWNLYHFNNAGPRSPLRSANRLHDNRALRPDGSNLAALLHLLRAEHEFSYGLILRTVQLIAPFFKDFVLEPEDPNEETLRFEWNAVGSDAVFGADALSDATLRFIALATLLLQPEKLRPPVILLDEPELGLHPAAITLLASLVRQASVKTQIILATQSSLLLDHFMPEDVVVADRVNGRTRFTRCADDKERLLEWLEDYSLGQLWLQNEIGGRPAPEVVPE